MFISLQFTNGNILLLVTVVSASVSNGSNHKIYLSFEDKGKKCIEEEVSPFPGQQHLHLSPK